jgi:hypothetical protein
MLLAACGGGGSSNTPTNGGGGGGGGNNGTTGPVAMNVLIPTGMAGNSMISQFVLTNSAAPVSGATFQIEWSAVDNGTGVYDWTVPDGSIQTLPSGEKANFVFWANADSSSDDCSSQGQFGDPTAGNCAIPLYVWTALTSANYVTCTPSNANGPQRIPNYFSPAFQLNYQTFIAAAISHYASNSQIGYIRFGLGRGGETIPVGDWDSSDACGAQFAAWGLTDATVSSTWEPYLAGMLAFEAANNSAKVQLMVGITPMNGNGVPDFVAQTAVPLGIGFGSQGLEASDVNNCSGSTADWCDLFHTFSGKVPLELQTIGQSCPQSPTSCATGSLVTLLPFAVSNDATILEIYYQDWLTAFDPGYQGYDSAYASVFTSAAAGN